MSTLRTSAQLDRAFETLHARFATPTLGIVLGSGLGHLAERIEDAVHVPYAEIPGMPLPSIAGHGGSLVVGRLGGTQVACLSGRVHLYEGHAPERVVFGVRLLSRLGVRAVLLTNAAGGIAPTCTPGSFLLVRDHLNLTGQSPLVGPNEPELGPRFPDMSAAYDPELSRAMQLAAERVGLPALTEGVYAGLLGPAYETPAEIRMLEILGASAVGMSTVHETLALRHLGTSVVAVSCVTNWAAGKSTSLLSHAEVSETADRVKETFGRLVVEFCHDVGPRLAQPVSALGA